MIRHPPDFISAFSWGGNTPTPDGRDGPRSARLAARSSADPAADFPEDFPPVGRQSVLTKHMGDFMSTHSGVPDDVSAWYDDGASLPRRQL